MSSLPVYLNNTNKTTSILNLSGKDISGEITDDITEYNNLVDLKLGDNKLYGRIPDSICSLTKLKELYLWGNKLSGNIPQNISKLANLYKLVLYENELTGRIPEGLSALTNLRKLSLYNNKLFGSIPACLSSLVHLKELNLRCNNLTGVIPLCLSNLTELNYLHVNGNNLTGTIPEFPHLFHLNISNNYFDELPIFYKSASHITITEINAFQNTISLLKNERKTYKGQSSWELLCKKYEWETTEIDIIYLIEKFLSKNLPLSTALQAIEHSEFKILHERGLNNWTRVYKYIKQKYQNSNEYMEEINLSINELAEECKKEVNEITNIEEKIQKLTTRLRFKRENLKNMEKKQIGLENGLPIINTPVIVLSDLENKTKYIADEVDTLNSQVLTVILSSNNFKKPISLRELGILLKKMNLSKYLTKFVDLKEFNVIHFDEGLLVEACGMDIRDACCFLYHIQMMQYPNYIIDTDNDEEECVVCMHNTPHKTVELFEEYNIKLDKSIIIGKNWIAPYFLFLTRFNVFELSASKIMTIRQKLQEWHAMHNMHLKILKNQ